MYVTKGGELYNFCPGKATWDYESVSTFQEYTIMAELKCLPKSGGINVQDPQVIENLAWFLPKYDMMKFMRKAEMILGTGDDNNSKAPIAPGARGKNRIGQR